MNPPSIRAVTLALGAVVTMGCSASKGAPREAKGAPPGEVDGGRSLDDAGVDATAAAPAGPDAGPPTGGAQDAGAGTSIAVDPSGAFRIAFERPAWVFAGTVGAAATNIATATGRDGVGAYHEVTFAFTDTSAKTGGIRSYDDLPAVVFTETYPAACANDAPPFPTFSRYPALPYHASYGDTEFAPVSFQTLTADSPFVFFDASANAFVLSAASDFMNAATALGPTGALSSGIDPAVASIPAGFAHRTALVAQPGIGGAFATWGGLLMGLSGKTRVANDATPYLERLGYWTDNGAAYYYQYDASQGYTGTLLGVRSYFASLGVPLAYMQLDSWWYPKGASQSWSDKAGGQYTYTADPTVLPQGLGAFQSALGLPLVTHARWIDASSPYRAEYAMSDSVSIDPAYWASVASSIAASGVTVYEQDWLNQNALPNTTNLHDQEAFMDDMAAAMATAHVDMQYCMPLPRHYLQGSKYPNLTTTRVSVDRFSSPRYVDFLFTSLLTSSLGAWPWSDTFNSPETDNLLLSTLSAGMVGVGDATGSASVTNLLQAVRPDGVIVKPDVPIVPIDQTFLDQASGDGAPLVAAARTDFGAGLSAAYVYAFTVGAGTTATFAPSALGLSGEVYVYDYFQGTGAAVDAAGPYAQALPNGSAYDVVVPIGPSGIAFLGDQGKFVSLGKKRIPSVTDNGTLAVTVAFAPGEAMVTLHGYATAAPTVSATTGAVGAVTWSAPTGLFSFPVMPASGAASLTLR